MEGNHLLNFQVWKDLFFQWFWMFIVSSCLYIENFLIYTFFVCFRTCWWRYWSCAEDSSVFEWRGCQAACSFYWHCGHCQEKITGKVCCLIVQGVSVVGFTEYLMFFVSSFQCQEGLEPSRQRWFFGGKLLSDKLRIEEAKILPGYVVQVIVNPEPLSRVESWKVVPYM